MEAAPLYHDVAAAPAGGEAWWLTTADGRRIRAAAWPPAPGLAPRGSVLVLPGRTEYIEKYGPVAAEFTARGFGVLTLDWRGQGLSERAAADPRLGHVRDFAEFQRDLDAAINLGQWLALPEPWFLVGHSMGGCIGLRALHRGLGLRAAAFSAPMWGIEIPAHKRPLAWASALAAPLLGMSERLTPETEAACYAATAPFEDNTLTSDPERFAFLQGQLARYPDLALGGPTLAWLRAALIETARLRRAAPPPVPALAFLGTNERIVAPAAIHGLVARWQTARLHLAEGAEHEILMERAQVRERFFDEADRLFV